MHPPRGWSSPLRRIWEIVKPSYKIVTSDLLLLLVIDSCMKKYGMKSIPCFSKLFALCKEYVSIRLSINTKSCIFFFLSQCTLPMHCVKQSESDSKSTFSFLRIFFLQAPPLLPVVRIFVLTLHAILLRQYWHSSTVLVASQLSLTFRRTWRANRVTSNRKIL